MTHNLIAPVVLLPWKNMNHELNAMINNYLKK